ncbi:MAG: hypothetical protein AAF649_00240 [Verrucomicrobiota bacterium]
MILIFAVSNQSSAIDAGTSTTYASAVNDRFSSGYPATPVTNTDGSYLALGFNLSGIGWSQSLPSKSFGMLSPKHYLVARHYGGASSIDFFNGSSIVTGSQSTLENTNTGVLFTGETVRDTTLGTFASPVAGVEFYSVLDLGDSGSDYVGQTVLIYGHDGTTNNPVNSPRIFETTITAADSEVFVTSRTEVVLQSGDSGSPVFVKWVDPEGKEQLTLAGNNAAITSTDNFHNLINIDAAAQLNAFMVDDGYALKRVGNVETSWQGGAVLPPGASDDYGRSVNWSGFSVPDDTTYVGFDSDTTVHTSVDLSGGSESARGLIFKEGASSFSLSNGTLNLGRGGIANYDSNTVQNFSNDFILTDHQWWDGGTGTGALNVSGNIDTNGKLLIVQGSGSNVISGTISGSGSLAKEGDGDLEVSGNNSYSGGTWIHKGEVRITNQNALGTGNVLIESGGSLNVTTGVSFGNTVTLEGGKITGNGTITTTLAFTDGSVIAPGDSPGTFFGTNQDWGGGGVYQWEISDVDGMIGGDPGYDFVSLSDTLTISATSLDKFQIDITSLTLANTAGLVHDFDENTSYVWTIATAANGISGFDASFFELLTGNFGNSNSGLFSVQQNGNNVEVVYAVPEPSVALLVAIAAILFFATSGRRASNRS